MSGENPAAAVFVRFSIVNSSQSNCTGRIARTIRARASGSHCVLFFFFRRRRHKRYHHHRSSPSYTATASMTSMWAEIQLTRCHTTTVKISFVLFTARGYAFSRSRRLYLGKHVLRTRLFDTLKTIVGGARVRRLYI